MSSPQSLATGTARVRLVQGDAAGPATFTVNGVDLSRQVYQVQVNVDGNGPARVTAWMPSEVEYEGPGIVHVLTDQPRDPEADAALVRAWLGSLDFPAVLRQAMAGGALDSDPADALRSVLLAEADRIGQP